MAKKKYRIYKAGGAQGQVMNPTAQFLARAQQGMQQPSEDEMLMMQQQQAAQEAASGNPEMMEKLMGAINAAFQNGATPEQVTAKLLEDQVDPEVIAEAFVGLGMEPGQAQEIISTVIEQLQSSQQGPSEEEMMAMQQQQMGEEAPAMEEPAEAPMMSKGAFVKKKLKMAQEGMQQMSNTNLAAEDSVNNVSDLLDYSKTNSLKNQFEKEYAEMAANSPMVPEARLGREARMQRREARRDARDERRAARQAGRAGRQMQRAYRQAYRKLATPPGMVPGFSAYSPSPFMGPTIDFEGERGLFGRLKRFKMHVDGMGFPMHFSNGMFMNGLYNPFGMPQGQQRIVRKLQTPGEVIDITAKEKEDENKGDATVNNSNNDGTPAEKSSVKESVLADLERGMKNVGDIENSANSLIDADTESLPVEVTTKELNQVIKEDDTTADNAVYWWLGAGGTLIVGDLILSGIALRRARNKGAKTLKEAAEMEGRAATEAEKAAAKSPQAKGRYATWKENWLKSRKQTRSPLTGKFQAKPETLRGYSYQKAKNLGANVYKYGYKYPARYISASKPASWGKRAFKAILSRGRKLQEGGFVDPMDPDYGNPDLYRFTGGGDFDYFGDQAYIGYEDVTDPYMPYMVDGGFIPMADNGGQYPMTQTEYYRSQQFYDDMDNKRLENQGAFYPTETGMAPPSSRAENISAQSRKNLLDPGRASIRNERMRRKFPDAETIARSYDGNQLARQRAETLKNERIRATGKRMSSIQKPKPRKMYYNSMYEYGGMQRFNPGGQNDYPQEILDIYDKDKNGIPDSIDEQNRNDKRSNREKLFDSMTDEQRELYKAEYERMKNAGYRGYRGYGYGQYPYRRGIFNTMMGIQAPAAIRRAGSWLSPYIGPTYSDGTPVIGGIPEGYHLRTGDKPGIEVIKRNMFDRLFPGKDAEGNRLPRGPRKSIKYYFEGPNDTTPSLTDDDNAISNFDTDVKVPEMSDEERAEDTKEEKRKRGLREKGAYIGNRDLGTEIGDRGSLMASGKQMRQSRKRNRQENRADRKSERTFRKIGRRAEDLYNYMSQEPLSEEGKARMEMGYSYGGMSVGDERYMTADEIAQFMAAGGQIEFL